MSVPGVSPLDKDPPEGEPSLEGTWDQTGSDIIYSPLDRQTFVKTLPSLAVDKNHGSHQFILHSERFVSIDTHTHQVQKVTKTSINCDKDSEFAYMY